MTRLWTLVALLLLGLASGPAAAQPTALVAQLERLSAGGSGEADYHLGMIHHLGLEGVARDERRALELFRRSAARGDPLGAYKLGCFYDGQGGDLVAVDRAEALRHKLVAAEAGYDLAQQDVAAHYGQSGDLVAAARWLEASARQGNGRALMSLAMVHRREGPSPNSVRAALYRHLLRARISESLTEEPLPEPAPGAPPMTAELLLAEFDRMLPPEANPDEQRQADALAAAWQVQVSPLTEKAGLGLDAARQLVAAAASTSSPSSPTQGRRNPATR